MVVQPWLFWHDPPPMQSDQLTPLARRRHPVALYICPSSMVSTNASAVASHEKIIEMSSFPCAFSARIGEDCGLALWCGFHTLISGQ